MREDNIDLVGILRDVKNGQSAVADLITEASDCEHKLVLMGETGVGKTTLGNYLTGVPLQTVTSSVDLKLHLSGGEGIGHSMASETTIPNLFKSENNSLAILDCPGINDANGLSQQIRNAFYIQSLFNGYADNPRLDDFHIAFVVRDSAIEVAGRGLSLHNAIREAVCLVSKAHEDVKKNFLLIVTGGSPDRSIESIKSVLRNIRGHWLSSQTNEGEDISKEKELAAEFIDCLISSEDQRIFLFPAPQSDDIVYNCKLSTELDQLFAFAKIDPLSLLDVNIVVPAQVQSTIVELSNNILKKKIIDFEQSVITALKEEFFTLMKEKIAYLSHITQPDCDSYLTLCKDIKEGLKDFSDKIKSIDNFKKSTGHYQKNYNKLIIKDIEILSFLEDFFKIKAPHFASQDVITTYNKDFFSKIKNALLQLICCGDIYSPSVESLLDYSAILLQVENLLQDISEDIQMVFLARRVDILNDQFRAAMQKLTAYVVRYIDQNTGAFNATIEIYRKIKSIQDRVAADRKLGLQGGTRLGQFHAMLIEVFSPTFNSFPSTHELNAILSEIYAEINILIDIYNNYSSQMNAENMSNQSAYLSIFETEYQTLVEHYKERVKRHVDSNIKKAVDLVKQTSINMQVEYNKGHHAQTLEEMDSAADHLRKIYKFFEEKRNDDTSQERINGSAGIGIKEICGTDDNTPGIEIISQANGFKLIAYVFNTLCELNKLKIDHPIETDGIRSQIKEIFDLVITKVIETDIVNVQSAEFMFTALMDEGKKAERTYSELALRFVQKVSDQMRPRSIWEYLERQTNPATHTYREDLVLASYDFLKAFDRSGNHLDQIKRFHKEITVDDHRVFSNNDASNVDDLITLYEKGSKFFKKNDNVVCFLTRENPFDSYLENFLNAFHEAQSNLQLRSRLIAKCSSNIVAEKTTEFLSKLSEFCKHYPEKAGWLLRQVSAICTTATPPWAMTSAFRFYLEQRKKTAIFELDALEKASEEYNFHYSRCVRYSWLSNPEAFKSIAEAFWVKIHQLRGDYPAPKPSCCWSYIMGCYGIFRKTIPSLPPENTVIVELPSPSTANFSSPRSSPEGTIPRSPSREMPRDVDDVHFRTPDSTAFRREGGFFNKANHSSNAQKNNPVFGASFE